MNELTVQTLNQIQTDVKVSMDDVVTVFVSRYEEDLFKKKEILSSQIRSLKNQLSQLDKTVLNEIDDNRYNQKYDLFEVKLDEKKVYWISRQDRDSYVYVSFKIKNEWTYANMHERFPIPANHVQEHNRLEEELKNVSTELGTVLEAIKSVGRKERQIKGKISEMKLSQSGFEELLNNQNLLELIKVE